MQNSLGQQAARGAAWSLAGQVGTAVLNLISLAILARLIDAEGFGLVAMVTAIVSLGELFRDFGLTNAAIQAPTLTQTESSNLFWLNSAIGLALGVAFVVLAAPIAHFYSQPDLVTITQILAITFALNGISTQPRALLIRELRLRDLSLLDVASVMLGVLIATAMALAGMGYWALVGLQVAKSISMALGAIALSRIPINKPNRSVSITRFLHFGARLLGAQLLMYISKNIDNVLIGRSLGAESLGIYSRAYQLGYMPIQQAAAPISRVALPVLSKIEKDHQTYNQFLIRATKSLMFPTAFGYSALIVFADVIIRIGLGPNWDAAVIIFQIICVAGIMECASNLNYWIFVSRGFPSRHLQFALLARPILIVSIFLTAPHGVIAVAVAITIWTSLAWPVGLLWASRFTPLPTKILLISNLRIIGTSSMLAVAGLLARNATNDLNFAVEISVSLSVTAACFTLLLVFVPGLRQDCVDTVHSVKMALPTNRRKNNHAG